MKEKETIKVVPEGVWEGSREKTHTRPNKQEAGTITTDLQGNGYPMSAQKKSDKKR